jgi:hypothetical protein
MFIPDPDLDFLPIPDTGVKKGIGSRNRIRNTAVKFVENYPLYGGATFLNDWRRGKE